MRKIKFRGKRVDTGEWIYGYLVPRELLEDPDYLSPLWIATGFENVCMAVDKETVGQFTGLNDKNGKEIYEGDILKETAPRGNVYCVFGVSGGFAINAFQDEITNLRFAEPLANKQTNGYVQEQCEVIGNIHETPELLND